MTTSPARLGRAIQLIRAARGMTTVDLAALTGMSPSYLSLVDRGLRSPSMSALETIAQALEISTAQLFILAESPQTPLTPEIESWVGRFFIEALRKRC